jgi:hypothetical protein
MMCLDLCRFHHWKNLCTMSHLHMTSRGILGYIFSGRNLNSLTGLKSLRLLLRIKQKKRTKVQRTDNGGEFCGNEFEELYKKCGIARQKTTPYTPQ